MLVINKPYVHEEHGANLTEVDLKLNYWLPTV